MPLGRGLASLIPDRQVKDPDDDGTIGVPVIEEEESQAVETQAPKAIPVSNTFDDFSQLEGGEEMPLPVKPLVTPLELDPEKDADLIHLAKRGPERAQRPEPATDTKNWDTHEGQVQHIPIGDITINPLQPRRSFDEVEMSELKDSIDHHGILQPLVVRRLDDTKYELIAGERRLRAAKDLGWSKVPCVVRRGVADDQTRLVYALIENIQRENLNPVDLALGFEQLHDEYGLSHDEIGQRIGKSRVSVTNSMRILQLPAEIQRGLIENKISAGHARAILMIPDQEKQVRFYQHMLDESLTVRKAETRARRIQRTMGMNDPKRQRRRNRHPLATKYQPALEERFATDANVVFNDERNRFEIVLRAYSVAEFEQLIGRMLGTIPLPDVKKDDDVLEP